MHNHMSLNSALHSAGETKSVHRSPAPSPLHARLDPLQHVLHICVILLPPHALQHGPALRAAQLLGNENLPRGTHTLMN